MTATLQEPVVRIVTSVSLPPTPPLGANLLEFVIDAKYGGGSIRIDGQSLERALRTAVHRWLERGTDCPLLAHAEGFNGAGWIEYGSTFDADSETWSEWGPW